MQVARNHSEHCSEVSGESLLYLDCNEKQHLEIRVRKMLVQTCPQKWEAEQVITPKDSVELVLNSRRGKETIQFYTLAVSGAGPFLEHNRQNHLTRLILFNYSTKPSEQESVKTAQFYAGFNSSWRVTRTQSSAADDCQYCHSPSSPPELDHPTKCSFQKSQHFIFVC